MLSLCGHQPRKGLEYSGRLLAILWRFRGQTQAREFLALTLHLLAKVVEFPKNGRLFKCPLSERVVLVQCEDEKA